ncbi:MAG: isochorismatase family protein [Pseudomonadota bacterium]
MMQSCLVRHLSRAVCTAALILPFCLPAAHAQSIVDGWTAVAVPPAPQLLPVTVESGQTALLILDMYARTCITSERPRCVPTIARVKRLLTEARAKKMLVVYSGSPPASTAPSTPVEPLTPIEGEQTVRGVVDKFMDTDLAKILAAGGIKTVIIVGTSADGTVLYTSSHAALNNLKVIVPVDAISSIDPFSELYTVWHLKNTVGQVSRQVTLTNAAMITIK